MKSKCPTCGSDCEVQGNTTKSFIPINIEQEIIKAKIVVLEELNKKLLGGSRHVENRISELKQQLK